MAKIVLVLGFVVCFGAGLIAGLEMRRGSAVQAAPTTRASSPSGRGPGWLTAELGLSAEQQDKLKAIWTDAAHRGGREQEDRRRQYRKERDDAIAALIRPEDKEKFELALKTYTDRLGAMEKEWRAALASKVEKTREILTAPQREKYEEILKRHEAERAQRDLERRQAETRPATTTSAITRKTT